MIVVNPANLAVSRFFPLIFGCKKVKYMGDVYTVYSEEADLVYSEIHGKNVYTPYCAELHGNSETQCVKFRLKSVKSVLYGVV